MVRTGLRGPAAVSVAAVLACGASAGCGDDPNALILMVTADQDAARIRVEVKGPPRKPALPVELDVDPSGSGRDLRDPRQAYELALRFADGGRYRVHVVDVSAGARPLQFWTGEFDVRGVVRGDAHLIAIAPGDDADGDGWPVTCAPGMAACVSDCNDADPTVNPFAVDSCEDGVDQDCQDGDRACEDADGDGKDEREDCDDGDPAVFPGQHEASTTCTGPEPRCQNGKDDDCVGGDAPCRVDVDCDGHYPPSDGGDDCDDQDAARHPGAVDVCDDGIDQDCDGEADDGCERCDEDGDGEYGFHPERGCDVAPSQRDCNDSDRLVNHMVTADCAGSEGAPACARRGMCARPSIDEDCDGTANEGCPAAACDQDGDGFAVATCPTPPPAGQADCNDNNPTIYPGAPEICADGILQNCNIDLPCSTDADGDKYNAGADCDDQNPAVHPFAAETCNAKDDDCDGVIDEGNPGSAGGSLGGATCTFDNDGVCATGPGRCVCSPTNSDGKMDQNGDRKLCPGEAPGQAWGPRCFGATQPGFEQCDALDWDCNERPDAPTGENLDPAILGKPCHSLGAPCVQGTVVGCDLSQNHPYYTNPFFVCSADERGPAAETCNGINDDCDAQTDEGFNVGAPCDGLDGDLCNEGSIACSGSGGTMCSDQTATNPELCNLVDDDCDGQFNEGFALGGACDGTDGDLCTEGIMVCNLDGTGTVCSDVSGTNIDTCNGSDDDCDGSTDEDFPGKGQACDGTDGDLCLEGVNVCNLAGNGLQCSDLTGTTTERCDAVDNDCDGSNNEGFTLGTPCDGGDGDLCIEGVTVCSGDGLGTTCSDSTGTTVETCNNLDDDCNTTVDDGAGAACGPLGDTCTSGACRCGDGPTCSVTVADNCSGGVCRCGGGSACGGLSDTCSGGSCKCGVSLACDPVAADACSGGLCKCGLSEACEIGLACVLGTCQ
jgi:hypothetical protein